LSIIFILFLITFCKFNNDSGIKFLIPLLVKNGSVTLSDSDGVTGLLEGVTLKTYTLVLNSQPTSNVVININFDKSVLKVNSQTSGTTSITFTSTNWSTAQTVYVYSVFNGTTDGTRSSIITHSSASSDFNYDSISINSISVTITDNQGSKLTSSFQSGTSTMTSASITAALGTSVNSAMSFVYCNTRYPSSNIDIPVTCQINSSGTSVEIKSGDLNTSTIVNWYVVEFSQGALVERGSTTFTSSGSDLSQTVNLSNTFDTNRTFLIAYSRVNGDNNNQTTDEQRTTMVKLSSTKSLELSRNEGGTATTIEWQVIQLDGARVESGNSTISSGNSATTASLNSAFNSNSVVFFTSKGGSGVNGVETYYYTRGYYSSTTELTFQRGGSNDSVDVSWFAVEFVDGTTVQSGYTNIGSSSTTGTANLSSSVDTTKTMILMSYDVTGYDTAYQDSGTFSAIFNSSSQIQFERYNSESHLCDINWFTIQFK
ncbi:MAG: hypothetical protein KDK36_08140, partial [Leptospiraceae bacterium]|nr:hypothetical protein [Leptospiraceae bacterium]